MYQMRRLEWRHREKKRRHNGMHFMRWNRANQKSKERTQKKLHIYVKSSDAWATTQRKSNGEKEIDRTEARDGEYMEGVWKERWCHSDVQWQNAITDFSWKFKLGIYTHTHSHALTFIRLPNFSVFARRMHSDVSYMHRVPCICGL